MGDAELVAHSLAGDRDAFGVLVERYQSLVCALAYSGCGDLARSEDIAQESFVAAWRQLGQLRERDKFKSWICGIARNLIHNAARRESRAPTLPLELVAEPMDVAPSPSEEAISKEEEEILWRALEQMPNEYREPMVLFYREGQSVKRVAAALELSEDAIKQRLSRGRALLRGRVAGIVETALQRSGPKKTFAAAVLAALPALAPQGAVAAAAVAAKEAGAAKVAATIGTSGAILGPLIGILGGYIGARASIKNTRSARERAFLVKATKGMLAYVFGYLAMFGTLVFFGRALWATHPLAMGVGLGALVLLYCGGLIALILWCNRRQRQIQMEEGTHIPSAPVAEEAGESQRRAPKGAVYGSLGGTIFGAMFWLALLAYLAKDWGGAAAVLAVSVGMFWWSARACLRGARRYFRVLTAVCAVLGGFTLALVNLRWKTWRQAAGAWPEGVDGPLWMINLFVVLIYGVLMLTFLHRDRGLRR